MKCKFLVAITAMAASCVLGVDAAGAQQAAAAPAAFNQCKACHVVGAGQKPTIGPNLYKVVGAKAGSRPGYAYSVAMKGSGLTWNAKTLDAFITSPQQAVKGTKMSYFGERDPQKRAAIIAYLGSLK